VIKNGSIANEELRKEILSLELLRIRGRFIELERRYRRLLSISSDELTIKELLNIKSNLAIIGVIYLEECTNNLSDYEQGAPNSYSINLIGPDKKLSTLQIDVEKMISKIEICFHHLFEFRDTHSIYLSEEVMDAFDVFSMLKRIISLNPICIFSLNGPEVSYQFFGKPWREVYPPINKLTTREILEIWNA